MPSLLLALQAQNTYERLYKLNKYWADHSELANSLSKTKHFDSYNELIQFHLKNVEQALRAKNTDHLSSSQKANREEGLNFLKQYWQTGQFPINTRHSYTIPYFIDDYNTACAVGHIMLESGAEELACRIATEDNNAYLEDMNFMEIGEWADAMGFEIAELKWIQPGYPAPPTITSSISYPSCGNTNGAIDVTVVNPSGPPYPPEDITYTWTGLSRSSPPCEQHRRRLIQSKSGGL